MISWLITVVVAYQQRFGDVTPTGRKIIKQTIVDRGSTCHWSIATSCWYATMLMLRHYNGGLKLGNRIIDISCEHDTPLGLAALHNWIFAQGLRVVFGVVSFTKYSHSLQDNFTGTRAMHNKCVLVVIRTIEFNVFSVFERCVFAQPPHKKLVHT